MKLLRTLAVTAAALVAALAPATAQAGTPFTFGQGSNPDVAVDAAGVAHVVWDEDSGTTSVPDALHYCRLQPGAKACSGELVLHPPLDAIGRSSYVFSPSAGRVVVVTHRCCGIGDGEGVWAYGSSDGGQSFDGGHLIGDIDFEGNAVFGPGEAVTGSTTDEVQTMPLAGPPATTHAQLDAGFPIPTVGSAAVSGTTLAHAAADGGHSSFNVLSGGGDPNATASWTPAAQLGAANDTRMAGGPAGIVLLQTVGEPGATRMVARKLSGAAFGAPVPVSEKGDPFQPDVYADPASGVFTATWIDNRTPNELRFSRSTDGSKWSAPQAVERGAEPDDAFHLQVAAGSNGKGFVVYDRNEQISAVRAVPLEPLAGSGGSGAGSVNGGAGETPVQSVTAGGEKFTLFAPKRCVKPAVKIRLRVTHKLKVKLSPKRRVKVARVAFSLDKKRKIDRKAAFRKDFSTKGFKAASKHKVGARILLRPAKGKGKRVTKTLKGTFRICS
jgi:hypothetical protein